MITMDIEIYHEENSELPDDTTYPAAVCTPEAITASGGRLVWTNPPSLVINGCKSPGIAWLIAATHLFGEAQRVEASLAPQQKPTVQNAAFTFTHADDETETETFVTGIITAQKAVIHMKELACYLGNQSFSSDILAADAAYRGFFAITKGLGNVSSSIQIKVIGSRQEIAELGKNNRLPGNLASL
ncbi:hypothetical protein [Thalassospira xiamenensis]|uniref:hypothetical protein n=1 Tax=Thalassospira xiamenensis TaxID=220697 RepID=UPI0018D2D7F8|nr:hypothetical protein [Thalassospira xiamenensis]MCD1593137.1 hypothetical protein [Thalassospira xiamenensis]